MVVFAQVMLKVGCGKWEQWANCNPTGLQGTTAMGGATSVRQAQRAAGNPEREGGNQTATGGAVFGAR